MNPKWTGSFKWERIRVNNAFGSRSTAISLIASDVANRQVGRHGIGKCKLMSATRMGRVIKSSH
jgi:hypothetical protein